MKRGPPANSEDQTFVNYNKKSRIISQENFDYNMCIDIET